MKVLRPILLVLMVAAIALAGFVVGRFAGAGASGRGGAKTSLSQNPSEGAVISLASRAFGAGPGLELPGAKFTDLAGLTAYVDSLKVLGLPEDLAKWIAISAKVREDLPGSLALARQAHLEKEWAVAVALSDPEHGLELVRPLRNQEDLMSALGGSGPLGAFFETLGRSNPELGVKLLNRLSGFEGQTIAGALFESWAKADPDAAMEKASQLKPGLQEMALTGLFQEWGRRDPHAMMVWASAQSPAIARIAFRAQESFSANSDPREALKLAQEFPSAVDAMTLVNIAGQLSSQGADGWKAIAQFPHGPLRDQMSSWFASRFAETDPKGTWELAKTLSPEDRKAFVDWDVRRKLTKVAPAEMAALALASDAPDFSDASDVVSEWAADDPRAAFEWSTKNLHGRELTRLLDSALNGWVRKDPSAAATMLDGLDPGLRATLLPDMLESWGDKDPQAALDYASQLPVLDRERATNGVVEGWADKDPAAAAAALAKMPVDGMDGAYNEVARDLADKDPSHAMDWAAGISDAATGARLARQIAGEWGEKDAAAVSDRLDALTPGDFRDNAVAGYISSIRELDPASAADWANSIADSKLRADSVRSVVDSWRTTDREAARTFVTSLPASPLKNEMSKLVEK